ncbi:hypothetical protein R1flu_005045 [Riccia fluitans]|uniref:Late embryogenesis abundant protein n=1 Tax=Riccia fluitans TaxID=41844 RepID=A0ABD1YS18_9MARC
MQGVMADVKEKVQNAAANTPTEPSATEKNEKLMAADEVGKEEAHARKHEREAEAYGLKEQQKAEHHQERLQSKQEAHDRAMQNTHPSTTAQQDHKYGLPIDGNPYVQAPEATTPTRIPHPHFTREKIRQHEGFPEDDPHRVSSSWLHFSGTFPEIRPHNVRSSLRGPADLFYIHFPSGLIPGGTSVYCYVS